MDASGTETVPQTWDDQRDAVFFRITAGLFPAAFCLGAGVLLAGNDPVERVVALGGVSGQERWAAPDR